MTDTLLGLVASYGVAAVLVFAYLSCLAVPVPTSLVMLAAGAFAAAGDLPLWQVVAAAFVGAVLGDQTGFGIGRLAGGPATAALSRRPARARLVERARLTVDRRGGLGVFLSRWLFAPLGPWVNLLAGASGFGWLRFTLWSMAGEMVWVAVYVGLGHAFAGRTAELAGLLGSIAGFLVAGLATVVLGRALRDVLRNHGAPAR